MKKLKINKTEPIEVRSPSALSLDEITIKSWIRNLIPSRSLEETELLIADLKNNGQRTKVIVTKIGDETVLLDGHGRYDALKLAGEKTIKVEYRNSIQSKQQIRDLMLRIQLGRRNISEHTKSRLRAEIWVQTVQNNQKRNDVPTQKEAAETMNVTDRTLRNDVKFDQYCEIVESVYPAAKKVLMEDSTPKTVIKKLAEIATKTPNKVPKIIVQLKNEKTKDAKSRKLAELIKEKGTKKNIVIVKWKTNTKLHNRLQKVAKENNHSLDQQIENIIHEYLDNHA